MDEFFERMPNSEFVNWKAIYQIEADEFEEKLAQQKSEIEAKTAESN